MTLQNNQLTNTVDRINGTITKLAEHYSGWCDCLFYICFGYMTLNRSLHTTMLRELLVRWHLYRASIVTYNATILIVCFIAWISIIRMKNRTHRAISIIVMLIGMSHWAFRDMYEVFSLCVLVVAAYRKKFRVILYTELIVGSFMLALAFAASQVGIIADFIRGGRFHAFGIINTTDWSAHVLFLILTLAAIRRGCLRWYEYLSIIVLLRFNMMWVGGKTATACILFFIVSIIISRFIVGDQHITNKMIYIHGIVFIAIISIGVIAFSILFGPHFQSADPIEYGVLRTVVQRLQINSQVLKPDNISLLGRFIQERGNGTIQFLPAGVEYYFIDCAYVRCLVIYGICGYLVLELIIILSYRAAIQSKKYYFILILMVVIIDGLMEQHMLEYFYNPFLLLPFADISDNKR